MSKKGATFGRWCIYSTVSLAEMAVSESATIHGYINLWYRVSADRVGGETSTNAANYFGASLKGRNKESAYEDHQAKEETYRMSVIENGRVIEKDIPLRNAMNEV